MLLASRRVIGDDGEYVSARDAAEKFGVDVTLFERTQRAMGLPRVEDPEAAVFLRADAEAAKFTREFLDAGDRPPMNWCRSPASSGGTACPGPPRRCAPRRLPP